MSVDESTNDENDVNINYYFTHFNSTILSGLDIVDIPQYPTHQKLRN